MSLGALSRPCKLHPWAHVPGRRVSSAKCLHAPCPEVRARLPGQCIHRHVRAAANPPERFPKRGGGARGQGAGGDGSEKRRREPWIKKRRLCERNLAVRQPLTLNNRPAAACALISCLCKSVSCLPLPTRPWKTEQEKAGWGWVGGKLMTYNCHDSGRGARQLFYIPGMYMQIMTKARHRSLLLWIRRVTKLALAAMVLGRCCLYWVLQIMKKNGPRALSQIIIPRRKEQAAVFSFLPLPLTLAFLKNSALC